LFVRSRKDLFRDLETRLSQISSPDSGPVWFHCASLGEFEQAKPLMEALKDRNNQLKILVTFFSPSGYEAGKNYKGIDFLFLLPVDTKSNVRRFIDMVKPSQVFFVKYDFWYNYLNELHTRKIPGYLVSANFREEQFQGLYGRYLRSVLGFFTKIFVQNELSAKILNGHNIQHVNVSGDLRFDKVAQTAAKPKKNTVVEFFTSPPNAAPGGREEHVKSKILLCGSTWLPDEEIIAEFHRLSPGCKLLIAPHDISEEHIVKIIALFPGALRFSLISKEPATAALDKLKDARVFIIDNIGMLSGLYRYADVAYIGGGFGVGIHNILEAVAFGVPVLFGPNHRKFPEANEIAEQGGGFVIANTADFQKAMGLLVSDDKNLKIASAICKDFVGQRKGATGRILSAINISQ